MSTNTLEKDLVLIKNPGQSLYLFPTWFVLIILIAHGNHLQNLNKSNTNDLFIQIISGLVSNNLKRMGKS